MSDDVVTIERVNTVLYCAAWAHTVAFYRDTLGLPATFENDWFVEFRLTGDTFISVADASRASISAVGGQGITLTLQVADVARVRDLLAGRCVTLTPISNRWGGMVCSCRDPEGHRIEFWSAESRDG